MDEYKHCLNCLLSRSEMLKILLQVCPENKSKIDREYDKLVKWFKDTYELKRKSSSSPTNINNSKEVKE